MAGYFYYLGRVFTEKGSWYKILTIVALQALMLYFNPQNMFQGMQAGMVPDINLPAILLYILASLLIFGFSLQIYSNSLNNNKNVLPDLDFGGMFVSALRFIPFSIVWAIYMIFLVIICGLITNAVRATTPLLAFILLFIFLMFFALTMPVIMALHAKRFSYKHVLNPLTLFRLFPLVAGQVALLDLILFLVSILLYGITIAAAMLTGFSGGLVGGAENMDPVTSFTLIFLVVVFFYVQNAIGFAYSLRLCDIIKSRLAETEYLDDDFDIPAEDENEDEEY